MDHHYIIVSDTFVEFSILNKKCFDNIHELQYLGVNFYGHPF